jgi:lipoate-protein ligase A
MPADFRATLTVRHGQIQEASISGLGYLDTPADKARHDQTLGAALEGMHLIRIQDWAETLRNASPAPLNRDETDAVGAWLDSVFASRVG